MYILKIYDKEAASLGLSGGKGASLARLSRLSTANVPDGFIITTEFFRKYILPAVNEAQDNVKQAVAGLTLPAEASELIRSAYTDMGDHVSVAVRSSATAEDLPDASFAGQQDTYLNVSGFEAVKKAVTDCFASLYNERAVSYRSKNKFNESEVQMAVVVQKMVAAKAAGVMFTADPMTSDRFTMAIEAVEGLGEDLVSGRKTPITWTFKEGIKQKSGGKPCLTEAQIIALTNIGKEIEREYGCPQDIEWCFDGEKFHIVQSRAITTLFPCPPSPDGFKRCFISVGHLQMMTDTMLPLGISLWKLMSKTVKVTEIGGRPYMEITHNLNSPVGKALVRQKLSNSDELMNSAFNQVLARKDYINSIPKGRKSDFAIPKGLGKCIIAGFRIYQKNDPAIIDGYNRRMEAVINKTRNRLSKLSGRAMIEYIQNDTDDLMKSLFAPEGLGPLLVAFYLTKPIDKAGKLLLGRDNISVDISKSIKGNITSEMGFYVSRIADAARDFPDVIKYLETSGEQFNLEELRKRQGGGETAKAFEAFFARYGMRCPGEIDIAKPRFAEEPAKILPTILADIKLPAGHAEQKFRQGKQESNTAVKALVSAAKQKWGAGKAKKLAKRLSFYRNFLGLRESPKYYWMKRYWEYKQAILREAEKLVRAGRLRSAEDVFYMRLPELADLFAGKYEPDYAKIDAMRADYEKYAALTPPRLMFSDGEVVEGEYRRNVPEGALPGLAVSGGVAEGRARVVFDIKETGKIEKGDILVTKFTDPSWTPAFISVGGLVTEVGGMATHGAVITREYGLPAVVGVTDATKHITDGDRIRVNGNTGYVEFLK
ncbi:phosphoenolpyruvate synthase [Clostridium sp. Marseille-P2415]|uniref:phosphoenolpyruvate synthase n=1 Tax=Clostridium sp. Marseille-P2415 TaxID=1805471 RepID=UPI0009888B1E|nr:phosphoenolpyruvate synthase [Clostridium sp. Marseille-P2415]